LAPSDVAGDDVFDVLDVAISFASYILILITPLPSQGRIHLGLLLHL
jgi:hypothetical protein